MENRYDKYKDSGIAWIGEIPEHWKVKKLGHLYIPRNEKVSDQDYPALSVTMQGVLLQLENVAKTNDGDNRKLVKIGDFAINSRSDRRGSCGISKYDGSVSLINTVLIPINDMNPVFYEWLFHSSLFSDEYYRWGHGIVNDLWTTKWQEMKNIQIVAPPLQEQQSIAAYLDQKCGEIDELITLQEKMITKLQSYKQSVITEAVTKGLDKNVPLKDSGIEWIGEIPEHWICTVFKRFLLEPMQYGANEPAEECNYYDPRYIRITDIKDDGTLRDDTFKSLPLGKAKEYMLTKGDLLFARSGATVGKTFLYKEDYAACFAGYLIKARCNKNKLVPNFVFYYTLSNVYQNWKNSIFIQSTIQNIGADKYSVMPIIVPPLSEQQAIADYLDQRCSEIDELISIKQQKIEKLKEYKKSLIFECVTGKRKVC